MPTIRLISAAPTAAGSAPGLGDPFIDTSFGSPSVTASPPTPLAPKNDSQAPRKRLVPKKSKLGLLVGGKRSKTPENNDLSDVVRRVGVKTATDSVAKNGFEIYVDPTVQSEVGEVLMVKKKKSRAALSALKWGTLAEVTNAAPSKDSTRGVRLKNGDKEKWWSIGRGRKDSKDLKIIEKENLRTARPGVASEALTTRERFHSLDSSVVLSTTSKTTERPAQVRSASASESPLQDSDLLKDTSLIPTMSCPDSEEMHEPPLLAPPDTATGSIAIRAMRSMRSVARLANWTNGKTMEKDITLSVQPVKKHKRPVDVKKKTEKRKFDSGGDQMTLRIPGSSEACVAADNNTPPVQASSTRKHGVLGLGFPSSFRFGTVRSSSAGSCSQNSTGFNNTSFDSRGRSLSTVSATSSLKPTTAKSRISSSSSASMKWVEGRLETVKMACRRERVAERCDESHKKARPKGAIIDIFPEHSLGPVSSTSASSATGPILMTKATSEDVHFVLGSESMATPRTQTRVRPASDQMTDKERLRCIPHDPDGILSALDAATNDLASLISRLDLEATPGTPRSTPRLSPSFTNLLAESPRLKCSPKKNGSREDALNAQPFRQQIAPWPVSPPGVPPVSSTSEALALDPSLAHSAARSEASLESRPLSSAKAKKFSQITPVTSVHPSQGHSSTVARSNVPAKPPSGKFRPISKKSVGPILDNQKESPLSNTFRKMMSTLSLRANKEIDLGHGTDRTRMPMSKEAQKDLGLAGTLGGSMSSRNPDQSMDFDEPDSDIPNELKVIFTGEDKFISPSRSRRPPSPGLPPRSPLPIPAVLQTSIAPSDRPMISVPWKDEAQPDDYDESDSSSLEENDTRRSFDFTSELKSLSESAGSHRHSFVEQLENAFRTPAKYDLDGFDHFGPEDVPPVPPIPHLTSRRRPSDEPGDPNAVFSGPVSPLLPSPDIIVSKKPTNAASHKPSHGQLNLNFKFGGSPMSTELAASSQLTLSDIIPSPADVRSLSMASLPDDFSQPSALPQAMSAPSSYPSARRRVNSDSSSRHSRHGDSRMDMYSLHSRASSQTSFKGLESFDEIRRGFEFVENRPTFYPPPSFNHRRNQMPRDSMISIASVSSYGRVINPGVKDPFDYGYQSRPASCDMSAFVTMSTSIDDTFSFIRRGRRRKRVDSDASSFYFRAPGTSRIPRPLKSQFRDSIISTTSIAPPVSIYNRSFGAHRGIDSGSGAGSGAHGYAAFGLAGGNRSSWAPSHRRELSADSVMSDISTRAPRPTLGDKMLDSRHDYCVPLTSITASPAESVLSDDSYQRLRCRGSFDSIMDDERPSYSRDSIMDHSNRRTSSTFESAFSQDGSHSLSQFRINDGPALSLFSAEGDSADPKREDDTMISMIGGGRVRRRSMSSFVEGSPIFARVGKRKNAVTRGQQGHVVQQREEVVESPSTTQKVKRSPSGLGEERMMSARQGLFSRDSLEEHCLCADGVDTSFMTEPVFSRPVPVSRSRSGTHSSTSSGLDTPSLSSCGETSSVASDSISSIDLSRVNLSLTNMSHPIIMQPRNRMRSKGHGHRRRLSGIQISRTSVYETIEEENHTLVTDGFPDSVKASLSPVIDDGVIIVDPDDASNLQWDERGIVALKKYYTLKGEADITIQESKQLWQDTPLSIYALQSFEPPAHRTGMRALLEHSRKTYGPLSAELRRIRSRTNSRPSPYPQPQRAVKISLSPLTMGPEVATSVAPKPAPVPAPSASPVPILASQALQQRTVNINAAATGVSSLVPGKTAKGDTDSLSQSRSGSGVRRSVLGWAKRGVGKENQVKDSSSGEMTGPGENLRLNRPRPRGRPSHARTIGPIKV